MVGLGWVLVINFFKNSLENVDIHPQLIFKRLTLIQANFHIVLISSFSIING